MKKTATLSIVFLLSIASFGQHTIQDLEKKITNGASKQWTLKDTKVFLGDTCTNGIKLSFTLIDKIAEKKGCVKGQVRSSFYTWEIRDEEIMPTLNFYNADRKLVESYKVQFVKKEGKNYLRLRLSSGSKSNETTDFYFQ